MKKSISFFTGLVVLCAVFCSCGVKKDIWKDLEKYSGLTPEVMENVRKNKYDMNTFSQDGYTVLTKFLPSMTIDVFNACVEAGADVNLADANGIYPLFVCFDNEYDVIHKVLDLVKDVNVKDSKGRNILSYLVKTKGDILYNFFLLVEKGVDTSVYDSEENEWPFIYIFNEYRSDKKLINYILSDDFKMCTHPDALEVDNDITRQSFKLIEEAKKNPLQKFTPENKRQTPPEENHENFLLMPGLIPQSEWAIELDKDIKHYLMCDIEVGSKTFKAGTEVKITGLAQPKKSDFYSYVDGVYCHDYKVMIDNKEYRIPARYISMYASKHTFDDTKETILLLSTFAITDSKLSPIKWSFIETFDSEDIKILDLVLVKDYVAYKIDTSEVENGFCYDHLEIISASCIPASPIIHGDRFLSPVDCMEGFYYLCGNKLKKIVEADIYYDSEDEPPCNEYISYDFSSYSDEELRLKKRNNDEYYDYTYITYTTYEHVAPYLWKEGWLSGGSEKTGK